MPAKIKLPNTNNLVKRYISGESENEISRSVGVSRAVIRKMLVENGITPRNQSESEAVKWSRMTANQRAKQTENAHKSTRGRVVDIIEKIKRAFAHEKMTSNVSEAEKILMAWLEHRSIYTTPQKAIGIYNVDLAIETPRIAVEIFGGNFHASGNHAARFFDRTKYLLDNGWNVIIVWVDGRRAPLMPACADYIVSACKEFSRNKTARGQYRVILGNGQFAPAIESKFNSRAIIERLSSTD